MLKESELRLRDMGEILFADIVGLVRETLVLKKKAEGIEDLPFPKPMQPENIASRNPQQQRETPKLR